MRLWPLSILPQLPRQQLLGQHRECCALRGKGWGKKHATVDYVFKYGLDRLYCYHLRVMQEMAKRGYVPDGHWYMRTYRGEHLPCSTLTEVGTFVDKGGSIYPEHDQRYLKECIENLARKGIVIQQRQVA
jgi:uncharacterized protein (TIGR02328 family)